MSPAVQLKYAPSAPSRCIIAYIECQKGQTSINLPCWGSDGIGNPSAENQGAEADNIASVLYEHGWYSLQVATPDEVDQHLSTAYPSPGHIIQVGEGSQAKYWSKRPPRVIWAVVDKNHPHYNMGLAMEQVKLNFDHTNSHNQKKGASK